VREEHRARVSEYEVLKKILGPKGEEVREEWRKLVDKDLHGSYSSQHIIGVTKSRKMRWMRFVTRVGEKRKT
jgi:hypothetical protein